MKEISVLDDMISAQKLSFEIMTNILGGDGTLCFPELIIRLSLLGLYDSILE